MTDRKQEVIDAIIEDYPNSGIEHFSHDQLANRVEALYDRIAPLIRVEFPEEEFERLLTLAHLRGQEHTMVNGIVHTVSGQMETMDLLKDSKRLWEGQDRRSAEERRKRKERDYNLRSANPGERFYIDYNGRTGRNRRKPPDRRK